MNSRAEGWCICGTSSPTCAGCHAPFSPSAGKILRSNDIERANDVSGDSRAGPLVGGRTGPKTADEPDWRQILTTVAAHPGGSGGVAGRPREFPARARIDARRWCSTTTPICGTTWPWRPPGAAVPAPTRNRMAGKSGVDDGGAVQSASRPTLPFLDRPLAITLTGTGGGTWRIAPDGSVAAGPAEPSAAQITGVAAEFPEWGTRRPAGGIVTSTSPATATTPRRSSTPSTSFEASGRQQQSHPGELRRQP